MRKLEGWKVEKLGDVCEIFNGGTPDTKVPKFWGGDILWITPKDMGKLESIYVDDTARKITDAGLKNSSAKILPVSSVILSSRAPIGHLAINTKEITTNQGCKGIVPKKGLLTLFLYYFLKNSVELLNSLGSGTTFKELSGSKLAEVQLPIPPLPEQQRIVAALDEAFASIAQAKSNAGRNLVNARELFESVLEDIFANPHKGWVKTTIGAEIDLLTGFAFKSDRYTESADSVRLLRGDNIVQGALRWDDAKRWPLSDASEYSAYELKEDDLVLAMDRPWIKAGMKYATISKSDLPCLLVQRTACLRSGKNLENRFLRYLISSGNFAQHVLGVQTGLGVPHISGGQIKDFEFLRPSLAEQRAIVGRLKALSAETRRLEEIYRRKLAGLEELKKSVLARAFDGEL